MKVNLVVLAAGKTEGKVIPVTLSQFVIGRAPECQLRPQSAVISKRHCAVLVRGGKAFLRDFDSTNGTFLNEQPVKGEVELHHDDTLKVGPLAFRVKIEASVSVERPTPAPPPKKKKPAGAVDDDSIAEMLLDLQDESGGSPKVVDGSTITEIPLPAASETETVQNETEKTNAGKKPDPKKPATANTSEAAEAILEKYMRRPRG